MIPDSKLILFGFVVGALGLSGCHHSQTPAARVVPARGALRASTTPVNPRLADQGATFWRNRSCDACHSIGGGRRAGPDLAGVSDRRSHGWLKRWLKNPPEMLESDSIAKDLLADAKGAKMPNLHLPDAEIDALIAYINQRSATAR
jgi:cytochrome c2